MQFRLEKLGLVALALAAGYSCSQQGSVKGVEKKAVKAADEGGTGADTGAAATDDTSGGADDSGVADTSGGGPTIEELIKQCGVDQTTLNNPDAVLFDKSMRSWPKVFIGTKEVPLVGTVNFRVSIKVKMTVHATMKETKQTTDFDITAEPEQAMQQAKEQTEPMRGYSTAKSLTSEQRLDLMSNQPDWAGILCAIQPTETIEVSKGGHIKRIKYSPPLPSSISPKADPARYKAEVGTGREFKNITATVTFSTDPAVPAGTTYTGSVKVLPNDPTVTLQVNGGDSQTIKADAAFRFEFNFGSVQNLTNLGLMPMQTFYISHAKRDLKLVVADTGSEQTGTVVMSEDL